MTVSLTNYLCTIVLLCQRGNDMEINSDLLYCYSDLLYCYNEKIFDKKS